MHNMIYQNHEYLYYEYYVCVFDVSFVNYSKNMVYTWAAATLHCFQKFVVDIPMVDFGVEEVGMLIDVNMFSNIKNSSIG